MPVEKEDPVTSPTSSIDTSDIAPNVTAKQDSVDAKAAPAKPAVVDKPAKPAAVTKPVKPAAATKPASPRTRKPAQPKATPGAQETMEAAEPAKSTEVTKVVKPEPNKATEPAKTTTPKAEVTTDKSTTVPTPKMKKLRLPVTNTKKKRKDTHSKEKFYIRNDLLKKLKALTKGQGKGYKTELINAALEEALKDLEA